jgi:hypothetical protein
MTMPSRPSTSDSPPRSRAGARLLSGILAGLLGLAAALLVSCGSSGAGLIPAAAAGPLQADFEAVERAAEAGNGSCSGTEAAISKTEQDFRGLPSGINGGLRKRLEEGILHLRGLALQMCQQPGTQPTVTTTPPKTTTAPPSTTTTTTPTDTQTTPTQTAPATTGTTTPPPTPGPGGGTPAGEGEPTPTPGRGQGGGTGAGEDGGGQGAGGGK